jgi:alkanesulfonate monooxygenase SsuD/methylene tetrahydromethanopterin reductase-like flavin-dependent oxidoreductase (luciferase family)
VAFTKLPERWDASWDNNLKLAQLADTAGIECIIPVARWKGFGGETNPSGNTFETITWACGLLAQTRNINVFGTVHVPMIHPVLAAKQMVTADHVGHGRFGLNIVCGYNQDEFQMFGVAQYEHDVRYEQGQEWWEVVKKVWSGAAPSDHKGKFYDLSAVEGSPVPFGGTNPTIMNAGASPAGRAFAIRNSDLHFDHCGRPEDAKDRIQETKRLARAQGREIQVWLPVSVLCRPSQKEVDAYLDHCIKNGDWAAVDHVIDLLTGAKGTRSIAHQEFREKVRGERRVPGYGVGYVICGDPDHVARELSRLHAAGFDGAAIDFVNYLDELPYFIQEVIPRLEKMGVRRPCAS